MKRLKTLVVLFLVALLVTTQFSSVNALEPTIDLSGIDALAQSRVDNNTTPGVTVLVKQGDRILYEKSFGYSYLYEVEGEGASAIGVEVDNPVMMTNDTLYDLASVTKVMATTQAMMMLVYQGLIDVDEPVATYMPEFGINGKENITARDLLTHTSGLAQWKPTFLYVNTREGERQLVNNLSIEGTPGAYAYSDLGFYTLGFLIEEVTGKPLEVYLQDNLYGPLGLMNTMFVPLENGVSPDKIAATSWGNPYEWRMSNQRDYNVGYNTAVDQAAFDAFTGWRWYSLRGEVNDGNAAMANEGVAGHAGLFSTANDLSIIGEMMLSGGTLKGHTFYDQDTIDLFTTKDVTRSSRGLGWAIGGATGSGFVGRYGSDDTFRHDGFTGTQVIFDKAYDLQVIVLSNKQHYGPYNSNGSYYSTYTMSREISELAYAAVISDIDTKDVAPLEAAILSASEIDLSLYTTTSGNALLAAIAAGQVVVDNPVSLSLDISDAIVAIETATFALVRLADKDDLNTLVDSVKDLTLEGYGSASALAFSEALAEAQAILANEEGTQDAVNQAYTKLQTAFDNLVELADKSALLELVNRVKDTDLSVYTDTTVETFSNALTAAQETLGKELATQDEVDEAIASLQSAFASLTKAVDKEELRLLFDEMSKVSLKEFTADSSALFTKALDNAKVALGNANATQEEVDEAVATLEAAFAGLKALPETDDDLPDTGADYGWMTMVGASLTLAGILVLKRKKLVTKD